MRRLFLTAAFVISAVIGAALGLFYTWTINPVKLVDALPDSLRADYKEEYVLMIAQAYTIDSDIELAKARLAVFKLDNPSRFIADLADKKLKQGVSPDDIQVLLSLVQALSNSAQATP